jgi:hypothetical protein
MAVKKPTKPATTTYGATAPVYGGGYGYTSSGQYGASAPVYGGYGGYNVSAAVATVPSPPDKKVPPKTPVTLNRLTPDGFKFNLPPHSYSLPLLPDAINLPIYGDKKSAVKLSGVEYQQYGINAYSNVTTNKDKTTDTQWYQRVQLGKDHNKLSHGARRGIMWFFNSSDQISGGGASEGYSAPAQATTNITTNPKSPGKVTAQQSPNNPELYNWGFQFLWNPTDISVAMSRNNDVTPTAADRFTTVAGMFPGQETISFTLQLDRTWDFACFKKYSGNDNNLVDFYSGNEYENSSRVVSMVDKIRELKKLGTNHDIEYLLRAINGNGDSSRNDIWQNGLKRQTADIGYLQPNAMAVRFGPTIDSMSYVGWISSLQIQHTAFTEDMIPIRSTVQISMDCFAASSLVSSNYPEKKK